MRRGVQEIPLKAPAAARPAYRSVKGQTLVKRLSPRSATRTRSSKSHRERAEIVLLDSGINASHPWFGSLPIEARVKLESARNHDCFDDNADDASDMFNHGTAVAAIMASRDPVGMAPELPSQVRDSK